MPIENPQEKTVLVSAGQATGALSLAFFGIPAMLFLCCGILALRWLEAETAIGVPVIVSLCLVMGYCSQSVRYYKGLKMPRLTTQGYIKAWVYWGAVVLFVVQVLGVQKGFMMGVLCLLTILEALCIFINFMGARGDLHLMELVVVQGVLHCAGGVLILGGFLRELEIYLFAIRRDFLECFPPAAAEGIRWISEHISAGGTIFLGAVLLAAAYGLRLRLYSLRSGEGLREFVDKRTVIAVGLFIFSVCFCLVARQVLIGRQQAALAVWRSACEETHYEFSEESSAEAKGFMLRQKDIGELLVMLSDSLGEQDAPYVWSNFSETMGDGCHEKLVRWYPEETGADEEDRVALAAYRDALDVVWQSLDAAAEALPSIKDAQVASGIYLLEEWRFMAALELGEYQQALEAMDQFALFGRYELAAGISKRFASALLYLVRWCEMASMMPDEYGDEIQARTEELASFVESLDQKAIICDVSRFIHEILERALEGEGGLHRQAIFLPCVEMLARMDDCRVLGEFPCQKNFDDVTVPIDSMCVYSIWGGHYLRCCGDNLQMLLARLSQLQ